MKVIVLITMILAIMAPVLGQGKKIPIRGWYCFYCTEERQGQTRPEDDAGPGGCRQPLTKRDKHAWLPMVGL
jgi:hypothetical protein